MYRKMLGITTISALLLALVLSGCGAVQGLQEATQSGTHFVNAIKDGQFEAAYAMFHPELQHEVGAADDLQKMIEDNQARPKEWGFTSTNVKVDENQNQIATLEGSVTYEDGRKGAVTLELLKVGDDWKVTRFNFSW